MAKIYIFSSKNNGLTELSFSKKINTKEKDIVNDLGEESKGAFGLGLAVEASSYKGIYIEWQILPEGTKVVIGGKKEAISNLIDIVYEGLVPFEDEEY